MDSKNFLLAFATSFFILYTYQYFFDSSPAVRTTPAVTRSATQKAAEIIKPAPKVIKKEESQKISINSSALNGFFYLAGNEIDHISLNEYNEKVGGPKKVVVLGDDRYNVQLMFESDAVVPGAETLWRVKSGERLSPSTPVVLEWTNSDGLYFERTFMMDEQFMITVDTRIVNRSSSPVSLRPKYTIISNEKREKSSTWISHEGAVGYLADSLKETSFDDMVSEEAKTHTSKGGWAGLTDKYWLVALIPSQDTNCITTFGNSHVGTRDLPTLTMVEGGIVIEPDAATSVRVNIFAGAKEIELLDYYEQKLNIKHFDMAVDYGYLYFITKPLSYLMIMLNDYAGNIGIAILLITILIRILLFPLANKSYISMKKMKDVQPKIKRIQALYSNDKQRLNEEMFALYKKEKINPAGSCLPMLLQIPFMFALYKVMIITIEMRHAPFYGWIKDLSAADPTSIFNLFGLLPYDVPSLLHVGAWPIIMGATMYIQQAMSPNVSTDETQRKMMLMLPIVFTYMMSSLSVGLIIYWTFSNIFQIGQQYLIDRLDKKVK